MRRHPAIIHEGRILRQVATPDEDALWQMLRARRLDGLKFRRKAHVGPWIVDFLCPEVRLVVEIAPGPQDGDAHRVRDLARRGLRRLTLPEALVLSHPDRAADAIRSAAQEGRA